MTVLTFDRTSFNPIFYLRAAWSALQDFVGAALGAFLFLTMLLVIIGLPGVVG